MTLNFRTLSLSIASALALPVAMSSYAVAQDDSSDSEKLETYEVTGSRIKRADAEGALPVTVIDRKDIELSGDISVADVLRDTSFNSFGSFRPASGSSAQGVSEVSLRGLSSSRTLILVDGRRAPLSPFTGSAADLNSIPLAAVERIEILTDGASAIYGSDAIGGVINVITRKDFTGVEAGAGFSNPTRAGGETEQAYAIYGAAGERGNLLAGASYSNRGIFFTRDRPWGSRRGISSFANNYTAPEGRTAIPGACTAPNFYLIPGEGARPTTCSFDFNAFATDDTEAKQNSFFARGTYQINDDWSTYMTSNVSRSRSFGRYAPTPANLSLPRSIIGLAGAENVDVRHRFAANGPRDNDVEGTTYDLNVGLEGKIGIFDLDLGGRRSETKGFELGRNYIVRPLAEAAIISGRYNIFNPFANSADVLNSIEATINRDTTFQIDEFYANASTSLFDLTGGTASIAFGAEWRREQYEDLYDSLQSAGVIEGASSNSAGGGRNVRALYVEALFPVLENLELSAAGRFDKYSDYGSDFSPKVSMRWQPLEELVVRASYGQGFRAPTLDLLTQEAGFSADPTSDSRTCAAFGNPGCANPQQIDATVISNPDLKQFSLGAAWDATEWLNLSLDYYNIKIEDAITQLSCTDLVFLETNGAPFPPRMSIFRGSNGAIDLCIRGVENLGFVKTAGIDTNIRTNFDFADYGKLSNRLQVGWVDKYEQENIDGSISDLDVFEGTPTMRATLINEYEWNDFSFNWQINFIDAHFYIVDEEEVTVGSWVTHDLQATWNSPWKGRFTLGVSNLENDLPAQVTYDGRVYNRDLYDALGRVPYFRYTQTF
jgi:iron complex outermembrane receptor protein